MIITRLEKIDKKRYGQIKDLLFDLYPNNNPPSLEEIEQIINSETVNIYIAIGKEKIIGIASAVFYRKLGGKVCIIEDVIVDSDYRGKGIGSKLTHHILQIAKEKKCPFVDVYTRRAEALEFYKKCGFVEKGENKPFFALRRLISYST